MARSRAFVLLGLLLVAGGIVGAASTIGLPWAGGPTGAGPSTTAAPAAPGGGDGGAATPTEPPAFELRIDDIEPCGEACRDVTATLVNNQDRRATGVYVETTIHAGDSTDGDVIWEGDREVGALPAGASEQDTSRIELGLFEAAAVQGAGGQVTIVVVVESDRTSVRFVRHRDVS